MKINHHILKILFFVIFAIPLLTSCEKAANSVKHSNNWQSIYQNDDLDLLSIKFLDKNNGFVFSDLKVYTRPYWQLLLTTADGGNTWIADTCKLSARIYGGIFPLDKKHILGIGDHVYKSSNTGETWTDLTEQLPADGRTFGSFIIDSLTWIFTRSGEIYRTNNGGQTWQLVYNITPGAIYENFTFSSSLIGYASTGGVIMDNTPGYGAGSSGSVLKTFDGGQSWDKLNPEPWKSLGGKMPYIIALQFITDEIGYLATYDSKLYKTVDGGNNWSLVHNNYYSNGLQHFISEDIGYFSDGMTVYQTNDGGKTWEVDNYNDTQGSDILYWTFLETGQGYALTRDHRILKNNFIPDREHSN
jgi:photosystem II stability/assembly factor-like uncharacterized protein